MYCIGHHISELPPTLSVAKVQSHEYEVLPELDPENHSPIPSIGARPQLPLPRIKHLDHPSVIPEIDTEYQYGNPSKCDSPKAFDSDNPYSVINDDDITSVDDGEKTKTVYGEYLLSPQYLHNSYSEIYEYKSSPSHEIYLKPASIISPLSQSLPEDTIGKGKDWNEDTCTSSDLSSQKYLELIPEEIYDTAEIGKNKEEHRVKERNIYNTSANPQIHQKPVNIITLSILLFKMFFCFVGVSFIQVFLWLHLVVSTNIRMIPVYKTRTCTF